MTAPALVDAPPGRPRPPRSPVWRFPGRAWRRLRRMDTALLLLLAVAVAAVLGTILPQAPTAPETVAAWRAGTAGPGAPVVRALDGLGLLDVVHAWWLQGLVVLLLVSLVGCILPRCRAFVAQSRRPVAAGRQLHRMRHGIVLPTSLPAEEALARTEAVLRRHRMRVRRVAADDAPSGMAQVAAARGGAREGGSLVFHVSIVVLLAGAAVSTLGGFRGQADVVEGEAFAETAVVYAQAVHGPWWTAASHRGFLVELERFTMRAHPDGTPAEFRADLRVDGRPRPLRLGAPVRTDGMTLHLARHGFAPRVRVRAGDRLLADQPVLLRQAGDLAWSGDLSLRLRRLDRRVPRHPDEVTLRVVLLPDARGREGARVVQASAEAVAPVLLVEARHGANGSALGAAVSIEPGGEAQVLDGLLSVEFVDVRRWAGLQVSHVPGRWLLLGGAALLLAGLTVSLRAYERRVWAEPAPGPDGGILLAGAARSRPEVFAERWPRIVRDVRRALDRPGGGTLQT